MSDQVLTASQMAQYDPDGYLIIPGFIKKSEVDLLYTIAIKEISSARSQDHP